MRLTKDEFTEIVRLLQESLMPTLERKIEQDVRGIVHEETMKLVYGIGAEEIRRIIQKTVGTRVDVEVRLK